MPQNIHRTLENHFKRRLRLIITVGQPAKINPRNLADTVISFANEKMLIQKKTHYLRADLLIVGTLTKVNQDIAYRLAAFVHEAGSVLVPVDSPLDSFLTKAGLKQTAIPGLYTKGEGYTPKEYGKSYIERWGDTDFMQNWRLMNENILDHIPRSFSKKTSRVLDVGCLNAYMMESLRRGGIKNIYGTDISYEIAINRIVEPYHLPAITVCDFINNTYPDKFADLTICMEVLEHLPPKSTDQFIQELGRVTSDRGVLLISTSEDWDVDPTHTNCRKRDEWYRLFSNHNMVPYGDQMIFSGFNSFVFKKVKNPLQKLYYHSIHSLSMKIPLWGGLRVLKHTFGRSAK